MLYGIFEPLLFVKTGTLARIISIEALHLMNYWPLLFAWTVLLYWPIVSPGQSFSGLVHGGAKNDIGYSLALTNDGGYIVAGTSRSYGAGSEDIFVVKFTASGGLQWCKTIGFEHQDYLQKIIPTKDGNYALIGSNWDGGTPNLSFYLAKISPAGELLWSNIYGGNHRDLAFSGKELPNGGFALVGYTRSYGLLGDILFVKTDAGGNELWSENYGTEFKDYGFDVLPISDGYILLGTTSGFYGHVSVDFRAHDADILMVKTDMNGQEQWRLQHGDSAHDFGKSVLQADDGGYYIFGSSQNNSAGSFDMLLLKTDANGNELWSETYGGTDFEYGESIDVSPDNYLYLFGTTNTFGVNGDPDFYLVKTDLQGNEIWSLTIGGNGSDYGYEVVATPDSGCALAGSTSSFGQGQSDFYFIKLDKYGNFQIFSPQSGNATGYRVNVYPNPVTEKSIMEIEGSEKCEGFELLIHDVAGKLVRNEQITSSRAFISKEFLSSGAYIYQVTATDSSVITGKFIIK
ncbi:MAG: hypothetical protein COA57_04740 [Flavobacteriales bacterium]|nr:MAG: hypothetical protein COA57_04740 [Flavobacteriales bacterium]